MCALGSKLKMRAKVRARAWVVRTYTLRFREIFTGKIIAALLRPPKGRPWLLLAAHVSRPVRRLRTARFSNDRRPLLT